MHAEGGEIESALEQFTGSPAHAGRSMMHGPGLGYLTHMKMPYVPMSGVTRNVFQHLQGASAKLPKLQSRVMKLPSYRQRYAQGGEAGSVLKQAVTHLANRDASSAAGTLMASKEAMSNPVIQQIVAHLRAGREIGPAYRALSGLANATPGPDHGQR